MSYDYSGLLSVVVSSTLVNELDLSNIADVLGDTGYRYNQALADGTGSGKAQAHWHDQRTLAQGADETLDLSALVGPFGSADFSKVKAILIRVVTATANVELTVGPAAATAFDEIFATLGPNGILPAFNPVDGWAVVTDTNDLLKLANTGTGSLTYDIIVIGEGAIS